MASNCAKGGLDWKLGKMSSLKECPALAQLLRAVVESPSLEGFKGQADVALGTWFSGGLGAGLMAGLNDHRGLSQLKQFYEAGKV